jgi:hypothetical protein
MNENGTKSNHHETVELLWVDISHYSKASQICLCSLFVFVFYLMYGYLQVRWHRYAWLLATTEGRLIILWTILAGVHVRFRWIQVFRLVPDFGAIFVLVHTRMGWISIASPRPAVGILLRAIIWATNIVASSISFSLSRQHTSENVRYPRFLDCGYARIFKFVVEVP